MAAVMCYAVSWSMMVKRLFDIFTSLLGVVIFAPLFGGIFVLIKMEDRGPIFYRGIRIGRFGKPFMIYKFRTMVVNADKIGGSSTPKDDPRITKIGNILRKYKLDELPQLFNVIKGDMSIVGPRPQVSWAVELYTEEEKTLLSVRPGITDYSSIKFRNEADILRGSSDPDKDYLDKIAPAKISLGLQYVRHHSLCVDLKIILATFFTLFGGKPENILDMLIEIKNGADGSKFQKSGETHG